MQPMPPRTTSSAALLPAVSPAPEEPKGPDGSDGRFAAMVVQASQPPAQVAPPPAKAERQTSDAADSADRAPGSTRAAAPATPEKPARAGETSAAPLPVEASAPLEAAGLPIPVVAAVAAPVALPSAAASDPSPSAITPGSSAALPSAEIPKALPPPFKAEDPRIPAPTQSLPRLPVAEVAKGESPAGAVVLPQKNASTPPPSQTATDANVHLSLPTQPTAWERPLPSPPSLPPTAPTSTFALPATPEEEADAFLPLPLAAKSTLSAAAPPSSRPALQATLPTPSSDLTPLALKVVNERPEEVRPVAKAETSAKPRENAPNEPEPARAAPRSEAPKEMAPIRSLPGEEDPPKGLAKTDLKMPPLTASTLNGTVTPLPKQDLPPLSPLAQATVPQLEAGVKWMIRQGAQEAQLQLHPEHLGQVSIHLKVEGGEVHAKVWVAEATSVQALQEGKAQLELSLRQQGLQLGSFEMQQGRHPQREAAPMPAPASPLRDMESASASGMAPAVSLQAGTSRRIELIA